MISTENALVLMKTQEITWLQDNIGDFKMSCEWTKHKAYL